MNDKQRKVFIGMVLFLFFTSLGFLISIVRALWNREVDALVISVGMLLISFVLYAFGFTHGRDYERAGAFNDT